MNHRFYLKCLGFLTYNSPAIGKHFRTNQHIRVPTVLLIDHEGTAVGEVSTEKALAMAKEQGLDLVEVSPLSNPPVCKILDFGNYIYRQKKVEKKQKQSQKQTETKTIRLSIRTDTHDLEVKAKQARKFIEKRHPLKVQLIFRGREITHQDLGKEKMQEFFHMLEDIAAMEDQPKRQGFQMMMFLKPLK